MLSIPPTMRVFIATTPADMRKSFDGLVGVVRSLVAQDPLSGRLYAFFNKRRTMMEAICWDRSGYCMVAKRLVRGTFFLPPPNEHGVVELEASELAIIVEGIDLRTASRSSSA